MANWHVAILNDAQMLSARVDIAKYIGPIGPTPELSIGTVEYGDEPRATITGTPEHPVLNLVLPRGLKGDKGDKGDTGGKGDKGDKGDTGVGIESFVRTSGNGAPGTTDIYTLTLTNGVTVTVPVYHGKDGAGSGNMHTDVYDADRDGVVDRAALADKASDADKLGSKDASEYVLATDVPSVPSWAMQPSKPAYTADEVGALAADGTATDSAMLNGQPASYYLPASAVDQTISSESTKPASSAAVAWYVAAAIEGAIGVALGGAY